MTLTERLTLAESQAQKWRDNYAVTHSYHALEQAKLCTTEAIKLAVKIEKRRPRNAR